jgi:hypothetical protein
MLACSLQRLAARVEAQLNPDSVEGVPDPEAGDELRIYALACLSVLDDPEVVRRLMAPASR